MLATSPLDPGIWDSDLLIAGVYNRWSSTPAIIILGCNDLPNDDDRNKLPRHTVTPTRVLNRASSTSTISAFQLDFLYTYTITQYLRQSEREREREP